MLAVESISRVILCLPVPCWHVHFNFVGTIGMFSVGIKSFGKNLGFFPEKSAKQREYKKHASYQRPVDVEQHLDRVLISMTRSL